ncbi:MAG: hypothetical protein ACOVN2_02915 [Usitatibacteraceae bacterium]|jgi:hypothetical protein|nr:hypothetical protein [Betaproteobacteria bacterium]
MKTLIISTAGNVGKTTMARHLVPMAPKDAMLLHYTSHIATDIAVLDGGNAEVFWPGNFKEFFRNLMMHSHVVVDVSQLVINAFLEEAARYRSTLAEFDSVLVPTDATSYGAEHMRWTVEKLRELGVSDWKIQPVFNMHDPRQPTREQFQRALIWLEENASLRMPLIVDRVDRCKSPELSIRMRVGVA